MTPRPRVLATLEGYAVEGGFDRPHEPATCYSPTIALGWHPGPGVAKDLWKDYEVVIDLAAGLGLDGIRLGLEWARIEPRAGVVDRDALDRYAAVARHAKTLGMWVTASIVEAAWPAWLGLEAWLLPWVEPRVIDHTRRVVDHLGDAVDAITVFARPRELVRGFVEPVAPPWRRGATADAADARAQLDRVVAALGEDPVVGPALAAPAREISIDDLAEVSAALRSPAPEVHLRSLVPGSGPTGAPTGLLARVDGAWTVVAAGALRELLA